MKYPHVRDEFESLRRVAAGASIARYGDGEFKHCAGQRNVSQEAHPVLSERLRGILLDSGSCMVGIPNIRSKTPKADFWQKFTSFASYLAPERQYCSAFITRPDSAPWINTPEYWQLMESLWLHRDVTVVRGNGKGFNSEDLYGAGVVREVIVPHERAADGSMPGAFANYDAILARIGTPKRAILCLGPTATVLAVDLCARGVHAIDLGHAAMFIRKYRRGESMELTKHEKGIDKDKHAAVPA
jgi:hypothetical protein